MSRSKRSSRTTPDAGPAGPRPAGAVAEPARFAEALAASVAAAPTGVVIADPNLPDCPIVFANPAFHRITGYPPEEVIGRNCRFLQGAGTDPAALAEIRRAMAERRPVDVRLVNYRRDGQRFVNELHISPVIGEGGRLNYLLGIQHDVTERVRAENAARRAQRAEAQARRAAERASAEKSDFLAFVSHEVRTPLNGVLGTLSLLLDTPLDAEQRAYAETARRSGETLLWTVNELLDLSRIEAGRLELEDIAFDPGEPVRDVLALQAAAAADKGLRLSASLDAALPPRLMGDPRRLRQVLLNLVDNAVKFTAAGAVEMKLARAGDRLAVEVRDTGTGIPPALRRRLFRRFQQADAGTARRHGGSGLGLMICRRLVGLMGGQIGVESEPGAGSVFRFDLPLRPAAPDAPAPAPATPAEHPARRLAGDAPFARLLLAEDSEASQLVAAAILRKAGYEVDLVRDGAGAVEAAASGAYDAVLMDVRMPGLDGHAATRRIRALPGPAGRVRILALTASAMPGDVQRSLGAGMDAHLTKPVDRSGLLGAVAALLAAVPHRPRVAAPAAEPGPAHALLVRETLEELRAAVGPGRLPDLVGVFAAETLTRVRRLREEPGLPAVEQEAHALQSAAGTFGAAALREAGTALERAASSGDATGVAAVVRDLPRLVDCTLHALARACRGDRGRPRIARPAPDGGGRPAGPALWRLPRFCPNRAARYPWGFRRGGWRDDAPARHPSWACRRRAGAVRLAPAFGRHRRARGRHPDRPRPGGRAGRRLRRPRRARPGARAGAGGRAPRRGAGRRRRDHRGQPLRRLHRRRWAAAAAAARRRRPCAAGRRQPRPVRAAPLAGGGRQPAARRAGGAPGRAPEPAAAPGPARPRRAGGRGAAGDRDARPRRDLGAAARRHGRGSRGHGRRGGCRRADRPRHPGPAGGARARAGLRLRRCVRGARSGPAGRALPRRGAARPGAARAGGGAARGGGGAPRAGAAGAAGADLGQFGRAVAWRRPPLDRGGAPGRRIRHAPRGGRGRQRQPGRAVPGLGCRAGLSRMAAAAAGLAGRLSAAASAP
jgi:PAS domain S-box-containing protein